MVHLHERLIEFILKCYLAYDDDGWQVVRFGFEKFDFEEEKELLFKFVNLFATRKPINQLVLDACKLDGFTDFSFLENIRA